MQKGNSIRFHIVSWKCCGDLVYGTRTLEFKMWVKFSLKFRGGQKIEEYLLYDDHYRSYTEDAWKDIAYDWAQNRPEPSYYGARYDVDYAIDVKLPDSTRKELLDKYSEQIKHAGQMIEIIKKGC